MSARPTPYICICDTIFLDTIFLDTIFLDTMFHDTVFNDTKYNKRSIIIIFFLKQEMNISYSYSPQRLLAFALACLLTLAVSAQELQMKVTVNHAKIQGTDASVFDDLQRAVEDYVNGKQWTNLQFQKNERIQCSMNITVTKYDKDGGVFTCTALVQANRPVFDAAYTTTFYANNDENFVFRYQQYDQLEFNEENVDNQLTALLAYYAYLFIGMNLDTFAPNGGTEVLQRCMYLVNNAQNLDFPGWKSFDNDRNRFAIINDYLDGGMEPMRQLQYAYYRKGLDEMANNADRGRTEISEALKKLKEAHDNKPLSPLPQIWTDFKKDELASIYKGKGTQKEKEAVYDILFGINASQNNTWEKIKQK